MSDSQKNTKPNVPNLRFLEFSEEWKESSVGAEFELYSGNTPSRLDKNNFSGDVCWITSGELKEHYIGNTKEKISQKVAKDNNLRLLPTGTFVIAIYGLEADGVRGTGSVTTCEATISQACMAFSSKGRVSNEFLYSWYRKYGDVIGIKYAQGTKQQNLSYDIIERFKVYFPSQREQQKLTAFMSLLDQRIAIQNKVIEKYESLIKALYRIFIPSSNGVTCQIGDILKIGSGKDYKNLTSGTIPVYGTGGYMLSVNDWLYDGESVCIGRKGTINKPFFVNGKFWTVDTLFYTYDFINVLPKYCYYLFQTIDWLMYNEASGVPSLSKSTIEKIQISIPSIEEQTRVVRVLDNIEAAIHCGRQLSNSYEMTKKILLAQLFI